MDLNLVADSEIYFVGLLEIVQ